MTRPALDSDVHTSLPVSELFTREYLEYYGILPVAVEEGVLRVAVYQTPDREVLEDLERVFGAPAQQELADRDGVLAAIRRVFSEADTVDALVRSLTPTVGKPPSNSDLDDQEGQANQAPVVRYVNLLIKEAAEDRASDIHVEAGAAGYGVRYRIDGVLSPAQAPPRSLEAAIISRLKLMADLDIAERRVPQDGRMRVQLESKGVDVRVSTVPTIFGESIVLRLLDRGDGPSSLDRLGMPEPLRVSFERVVRRPHGIVLATGPTGSGKTTTLYCALQLRDRTREKIITVEDPVEYQLPGITQVPVNRKANVTFAAGLRAILRQDPDVVLVGEMRDEETARVAVQAAMTGHLVLSTVHTNDAASAVTRLVDLGIEPYLVAATLQGVLAQRLVRRVCPHCAEWRPASEESLSLAPVRDIDKGVRRGEGCALCRHSGYLGRLGLFEFIEMSDELRTQIVRSPEADRIRRLATEAGAALLQDDGRAKVRAGDTTPEEVLRAVQV